MNYLKAMRDALEALENYKVADAYPLIGKKHEEAITQLRAAIEAWKKEEPIGYFQKWGDEWEQVQDCFKDDNDVFPVYLRKDEE